MIQPGQNYISSVQRPPEKQESEKTSKDEEIQKGSVSCAEEDGVVLFTIRVKEGAAVLADEENASVWLTGTLGEKTPPFRSASWL